MDKEIIQDYYFGLDIGTDSIGWAVTDKEYKLIKVSGKPLWGVRLFDTAKTAAERRAFRSIRRRGLRKTQRIQLLQELFADEVNKVDPGFFQRLKDSPLLEEDKHEKQTYTLFSGRGYSDIQYHRDYPTIYHLRKALLKNNGIYDVRLVYLAIHHILKHRGHFLFSGTDIDNITSFKTTFETFSQCLKDEFDIFLECDSIEEVEEILKNKKTNRNNKRAKLIELFHIEKTDNHMKAIISLIVGLKASLSDVFNDDKLEDIEKQSISFGEGSYDETRIILEEVLQERCYIIDVIKSIYDWTILADILKDGEMDGKSYISVSKVKIYEKHRQDLLLLKKVIKQHCSKEVYRQIFDQSLKDNYCAYIGMRKKNGKKYPVQKTNKEAFYIFINKILSKITTEDSDVEKIRKSIASDDFLPLQISKDNGVIPNQVHKMELIQILDNAQEYLPFLNAIDETGLSVKEKIIKIFEFRIPYYVGPLNTTHTVFSWMKRKEPGAIRPWNFDDKVDIDATAEMFKRRMTNKCTYLFEKDVIPKNSLLYSEFMVLNELNNVKIRHEKLPVELKQKIFNELFMKRKKVTDKALLEYLNAEGYEVKAEDLSGFDSPFKASMSSYLDFKKIFGKRIREYSVQEKVEHIILFITLYGEEKNILIRTIRSHYSVSEVSNEQLKEICKLKYQGWGRLSQEFLQDVVGANKETGEIFNITQALRNTNDNLMQLLSSKYTFSDEIQKENMAKNESKNRISYESIVKDLIISPSIKRSIWQCLLIVEEIVKITGKLPKKIFIEVARGHEEKKRTQSRKDKLIELYEKCKVEEYNWKKELENTPESKFKSDKLFLYYTQMGRCMYTGKTIELSELANANIYDKDHIYPRSKTKDDSIDNLVLVDRTANAKKDDEVLSAEIQKNMEPFWKCLKEKGFISKAKYERLTRKTPLSDEELADFINRQLVETRQSTKIVADLLKNIYTQSEIIYVKANTVSDFRQKNLEMLKVRDVNDYHHAKDAYLNIVVGNVYNAKFTSNPLAWLKQNHSREYNLGRMFINDVYSRHEIVWKRGNEGTLALIRKTMLKNNILFTRYSTCNKDKLFAQQIVGKNDNATVSIKKGMDVKKYGGYKTITPAYFILVESLDKKQNKQRTIEAVPLYKCKEFENNLDSLQEYLGQELNLIQPKIIMSRIKKNAYIIVDGFPMHLRGTTGTQLLMQCAVQLIISTKEEAYFKKIMNYLQRNSERKDKKTVLPVEDDIITKKSNIALYDLLNNKLNNSIYKYRKANQSVTLAQGRDIFQALSLEEQCIVLGEILHLFQCKPLTSNLKLVCGAPQAGNISINKRITLYNSAKLVHQSVTGFFEQVIDLLTV